MGRGLSRWPHPRGRALLLAYALLLLASHAVRATRPHGAVPGAGASVVEVDGVEIAVGRSEPPRADPARLPVLLLHGSPGGRDDLRGLARALERWSTLRPDLPGFGASQRRVPDYSVHAHARYVLGLLDRLGIERVHVVAYSMGGGVGIELCDAAPARVASLTMLSAIGVQELELFGDHEVNHLLHGAQLAFLLGARELLPHFGLLDRSILSVEYARNFFDTDQRSLRGMLERWAGPTLILHGRSDVLVPYAAALEHARIVPQSELETLGGGHLLVFTEPELLARRLAPFLEDVEAGRAPTRASAAPERLARAREPFDPRAAGPVAGFGLLLFVALAAAATLLSEDLTCLTVGALVGQGRVAFLPGALACLVGITVGDFLLFLAGRTLGRRAVGHPPLSWFVSAERVRTSSVWFRRRGPAVIVASRFLPGTRLPTYFAAGLLRTSFWRFLGWFLLASALWTPALVWLASLGGGLTERIEPLRAHLALGALVTVVAGVGLVKGLLPLATQRGRLLRRAAWTRLVRWEFWPRWVVYAPIAVYLGWLTLRHRGRLCFTAANPAMPLGGFVGESKGDILAGLARGCDAVARTLRVDPAQGVEACLASVERFHGPAAPDGALVVKPDVGQRGDGVRVCRGRAELRAALAEAHGEQLVQEYVGGVEYGLFYARGPGEPRGRLISITEKRLPWVEGDGRRTLEGLILHDPWVSLHASQHLANLSERLQEVPAAGERVLLGELGTHCRGARFLDGGALATPELEQAVERVSRGYAGFHFGRYDVRAESPEALAEGRFKVLELNGVTSEVTHVYDPRYSALDGWRALAAQWRLAFEIGAENARRGARCATPAGLVRALVAYRGVTGGAAPRYAD